MTKIFSFLAVAVITVTSCTKQVNVPESTPVSGPQLTFKNYSIVTVGDTLSNVTAYAPFTYPATGYINYLNTAIVPMQCGVYWFATSESGQSIQMGSMAQVSEDLVAYMQNNHRFTCKILQFQNEETDHYTDGSLRQILVGQEYYAIVKVQ